MSDNLCDSCINRIDEYKCKMGYRQTTRIHVPRSKSIDHPGYCTGYENKRDGTKGNGYQPLPNEEDLKKMSEMGLKGAEAGRKLAQQLTKREHFAFEFAKIFLERGVGSDFIPKESAKLSDELIKALNEEKEG